MITAYNVSHLRGILQIDGLFEFNSSKITRVLSEGPTVIGFYVVVLRGSGLLEIESFMVHDSLRRLGYGSQLMGYLIGNCYNARWLSMNLRETVEVGSCYFLKSHGFVCTLRGSRYYFTKDLR